MKKSYGFEDKHKVNWKTVWDSVIKMWRMKYVCLHGYAKNENGGVWIFFKMEKGDNNLKVGGFYKEKRSSLTSSFLFFHIVRELKSNIF